MGTVTPVYGDDYNNRFKIIILAEDLYDPEVVNATGNKRVARAGDVVWDKVSGTYDVVDVLPNGKAVLEPFTLPNDEGLFANTLIGVGNTSFRAYVDYTPNPPVFSIDSLLKYNGSDHSHIKVFLGTDPTGTGEPISAYYNESGNLVGENIPMELVEGEELNNTAKYAPVPGSLKRPIQENELITVIAYGLNNVVRSVNVMALVNTSFVRRSEASQRQIVNIELVSSYLSPTDNRQVLWPTNANNDASHLMARVTYTDRTVDYPVDGNKFFLSGFRNFIPSREGQTIPLVLHYKLANDEIANLTNGISNFDGQDGRTIFKNYSLTTVQGLDAYSVTLFAAPVWRNAVSGYRMEYYLYNKQRNEFRYVTPYVTQQAGSAPFEPTTYGVNQKLDLEINLAEVSAGYNAWRHSQTIYVNLQRRGDIQTIPNWLIQYQQGQSPAYGTDLAAILTFMNGSTWNVDIDCGKTDVEDWLQRTYFASKPIFDPVNEVGPLDPTHLIIYINNQPIERELAQWNVPFQFTGSVQQGGLLGIRFVRRTNDGDLELAYAAMSIYLQ